MSVEWGSKVNDKGRIGLEVSVSNSNTASTVSINVWFWSKYSVDDTNNTLYVDDNATSATTSRGKVTINTTVATGSGWSTSNQKKIYTLDSFTVNRGTSKVSRNCAAKLTNIEAVDGTMTVSTSYDIPALASYTVSFNANGGSGAPSSQTKYYGKTLTLSSTTPTRSGYTFLGWSTSSSATSATYKAGGSYTANAAATLYAIWRKTITVTYNANNGSDAPSATTGYMYNSATSCTVTLSSDEPTRTNYSFLGWSTSSSATSASYSPGGQITISANTTLYAVWQNTGYTIKYYANGGSNAPGSQVKTAGKSITLSSSKPTRSGYSFTGWATSSTGSVAYQPGATYSTDANLNLYAVWTPIYTVKYNANCGSGEPASQEKKQGASITLSSTKPTRKGYDFKGWGTSRDTTTVSYAAGATYSKDASITLYAVWTKSDSKVYVYINSNKIEAYQFIEDSSSKPGFYSGGIVRATEFVERGDGVLLCANMGAVTFYER